MLRPFTIQSQFSRSIDKRAYLPSSHCIRLFFTSLNRKNESQKHPKLVNNEQKRKNCSASDGGSETCASQVKPFSWRQRDTWHSAARNTLRCLAGCSFGDFSALFFIQSGAVGAISPATAVAISMSCGIATSVGVETAWLKYQSHFQWTQAFRTACGMSFISMLSMESASNAVEYVATSGAMTLDHPAQMWALPLSLVAGFLTPLPYNYFMLAKYGKSCH